MPDGNLPNFLDSELTSLEERFLKRFAILNNLSYSERIQLATELDFFKVLESSGLTKVVEKIEKEYSGIIKDLASFKTQGISALTLQDLDLVLQLDQRSLLRSAESYASQFQSRLIKGFISGEDTTEIEKDLRNIGLRTNQTISAINTARDQFNAVAVAKLFEDEPETRFKLSGPLDPKTRCSCKAVLTKQPKTGFTKAEIDKGAWHKIALANCADYAKQVAEGKPKYNFVNRGGYSCRHFVEIVEDANN